MIGGDHRILHVPRTCTTCCSGYFPRCPLFHPQELSHSRENVALGPPGARPFLWPLALPAFGVAHRFPARCTPATRVSKTVLRAGVNTLSSCQRNIIPLSRKRFRSGCWGASRQRRGSCGARRCQITTLRHRRVGNRTANLSRFHPFVCTNLCRQYVVLRPGSTAEILLGWRHEREIRR